MEWRLVAEMSLSKLIQKLFAYVKRYEVRVSLYFAEMKRSAWKLWKPNPIIWLCLNALSLFKKKTDKLNVISKEIFFRLFNNPSCPVKPNVADFDPHGKPQKRGKHREKVWKFLDFKLNMIYWPIKARLLIQLII